MLNFYNLRLGQKLTAILLLIFFGGTILSGTVLSHFLHLGAQEEITSQALILIETMNAVRDYTSNNVKPRLANHSQQKFWPETVPAYSAREVFEKFREDEKYKNFLYKEAAINPTNPRDQADSFETELIQQFRQSPELQDLEGFRSDGREELFYIASPISVSKTSCLECHSTADVAPKSLVERYGDKRGFGWTLNEIVGTQIILVPVSQVIQNARQSFLSTMGIVMGIFALVIFLVNLWLRRTVVRPLTRMADVAEVASQGDLNAEFQKLSNDEIGNLADAFSRMKISFALAMKKLEQEKRKNRDLRHL